MLLALNAIQILYEGFRNVYQYFFNNIQILIIVILS
jgi:hypothetical protein